jgi:hypothetical protein
MRADNKAFAKAVDKFLIFALQMPKNFIFVRSIPWKTALSRNWQLQNVMCNLTILTRHVYMDKKYLMPTQDAGRDFVMRQIQGSVVMLNLIRFRKVADYSTTPELSPNEPISGESAYQIYIQHTLPFLTKSGGEILFMGEGGAFLIGPSNERWDAVLLIRQNSVNSFLAFESDKEYMKGIGHRTAALEDSRLLPLVENKTI